MSLSRDLARHALDRIVLHHDLAELQGEGGGSYLTLTSPAAGDAEVGELRILHGGPVHKLVYIGLAVPPIGLDSHMVFAFTAPDSLVPHFTLDSVQSPAGPPGPDTPVSHAFHLDLIPRVDLATNHAYVEAAYGPLSDAFDDARRLEGLSEAHLSRQQWAVMSPWMLANRATPEAFTAIRKTVDAYLDHWLRRTDEGIDVPTFGADDLAGRDRAHRRVLFDPQVDPVWGRVAQLVGDEVSEQLRLTLIEQELPRP